MCMWNREAWFPMVPCHHLVLELACSILHLWLASLLGESSSSCLPPPVLHAVYTTLWSPQSPRDPCFQRLRCPFELACDYTLSSWWHLWTICCWIWPQQEPGPPQLSNMSKTHSAPCILHQLCPLRDTEPIFCTYSQFARFSQMRSADAMRPPEIGDFAEGLWIDAEPCAWSCASLSCCTPICQDRSKQNLQQSWLLPVARHSMISRPALQRLHLFPSQIFASKHKSL